MTLKIGIHHVEIFLGIENRITNDNTFKYFVVHSAFRVKSLLGSHEKPDTNDLPIADGINEIHRMLVPTRNKILNTAATTLSENL